MKEFFKRAIMGFVYGVFIGQTILILESLAGGNGSFNPVSAYLLQHSGSQMAAVIIQYFLTGIIGISFATITLIFEIDSWSITAQTALHFVITSVVMYISGFLCGWFPHTVRSTIIWFAIFIVIYVIMWAGFMLYFKKQTKKINEAL